MSKIRSKNTKPEIAIRKALYKLGLRYRIHYKIPGKPDIAFPKHKIAVFVNGCFWHHHECKDVRIPKSNISFWKKKLERNKVRDNKNYTRLKEMGWEIEVLWACEVNTKSLLEKKIKNLIAKLKSQ